MKPAQFETRTREVHTHFRMVCGKFVINSNYVAAEIYIDEEWKTLSESTVKMHKAELACSSMMNPYTTPAKGSHRTVMKYTPLRAVCGELIVLSSYLAIQYFNGKNWVTYAEALSL